MISCSNLLIDISTYAKVEELDMFPLSSKGGILYG